MKLSITTNNPLHAEGEKGVALEKPRGESAERVHYRSAITHPVFAWLDQPLFGARKEGNNAFSIIYISEPTLSKNLGQGKMRRRCISSVESVENISIKYLACRRYATRGVSYLWHEVFLLLSSLPTCNPDGVLYNYNSPNVS